MAISRNVGGDDWSVSSVTHPATGGLNCTIQLTHNTPEGVFKQEFTHSRILPTELDAVLAALREGMVWFQFKMSKSLSV